MCDCSRQFLTGIVARGTTVIFSANLLGIFTVTHLVFVTRNNTHARKEHHNAQRAIEIIK